MLKLVKSHLYQDFNVSLSPEWNDQRLSRDHNFLTEPPEQSQSTNDNHECFGNFDTLSLMTSLMLKTLNFLPRRSKRDPIISVRFRGRFCWGGQLPIRFRW